MAKLSFVPSIPSNPEAFLPPPDAASAGASRAPLVRGVAVFCMLVLTAITFLRLYTRRFVVHTIGLDDYLAVVAWVSAHGLPLALEDREREESRDRRQLMYTLFILALRRHRGHLVHGAH